MNLLKTSFLSAIETAVKLASGFVVIKYIATKVGPEGVAYFGQFQNFIAAFIILVSGSATTGLVCFSAKERANNKSPVYLGNTLGLGIISSLVVGLILCVFSKDISFLIFKTNSYYYIFYLLSIAGFFIMTFQAVIAQLNGLGELTKLLTTKGASSIILLLCSLMLVHWYGLSGGLIALICMQSISAMAGLWLLKKVPDFKWSWLKPKFNLFIYKDLSVYWLAGLVTLISSPLVLILVRMTIVEELGWDVAGIWEASWKISELYLLVITTGLTTYYVPKLSKAKTPHEELLTIREVAILGVVSATILALGVYTFRSIIVSLLFSVDFLAATSILKYQLLGSVVKIISWVFAYHMLVKKKITIFLISELFFGASFYVCATLFLRHFGLVGLSYAYFINYCFYFIFCVCYLTVIYIPQWDALRLKICLR